jgi:hypothetical protein
MSKDWDMGIGSWFGLGKDAKKFGPPTTVNGKPIVLPGASPGPGPATTPDKPTPPPSATVAASEAITAANTAGSRQKKRAAAGNPLAGGLPRSATPWSEHKPGGRTPPRTLIGGV